MNKTAIAFLTKDRTELSKQSIEPLLQPDKFDLYWIDGSVTKEGHHLPDKYCTIPVKHSAGPATLESPFGWWGNVCGGAGAAIVFSLTKMLNHPAEYDYVGLVENDVLLGGGWFDSMAGLFEKGHADGLKVGAVAARCYRDRVLFQRDGYAVCHNLGAGNILFSRAAARLILDGFRSGFTADNRRIFGRLSGIDLASFWAFGNSDHNLVADWHWDATLAAHGLASLALTPSPCRMIGQDPPLAEQGLTIADGPVEERIDNDGFRRYRDRLEAVRDGQFVLNVPTQFQYDVENASWHYCPHQFRMLGAAWQGNWAFKEMRAYGEFGWVAGSNPDDFVHPSLRLNVAGTCVFVVSGGKTGGQIRIEDEHSGYVATPYITPEGPGTAALQIPMPSRVPYRAIHLTALTPGVTVYRLSCREQQAAFPDVGFDHADLPPAIVF